jgi:hypothetical protein
VNVKGLKDLRFLSVLAIVPSPFCDAHQKYQISLFDATRDSQREPPVICKMLTNDCICDVRQKLRLIIIAPERLKAIRSCPVTYIRACKLGAAIVLTNCVVLHHWVWDFYDVRQSALADTSVRT